MQLSAYFTRISGRGRRVANPRKHCESHKNKHATKGNYSGGKTHEATKGTLTNSPSSYALAATLAAMWPEIFLILENGG